MRQYAIFFLLHIAFCNAMNGDLSAQLDQVINKLFADRYQERLLDQKKIAPIIHKHFARLKGAVLQNTLDQELARVWDQEKGDLGLSITKDFLELMGTKLPEHMSTDIDVVTLVENRAHMMSSNTDMLKKQFIQEGRFVFSCIP